MTGSTREPTAPNTQRRWRTLARRSGACLFRVSGIACMALGAIALMRAFLDAGALQALAGAVTMPAQSALAFLACGLSLVLHPELRDGGRRRALRLLAQGLGGTVALAAFWMGATYLFDSDLGLGHVAAWGARWQRPSPPCAAGFIFVGSALVLLPVPRLRTLVQGCAAAAGVIGLMGLAAYFWGGSGLRLSPSAPQLTVDAAAGLVLLGVTLSFGAYRFAPGPRSLRFLLDPVELTVITSFASALLILAVVGGLSHGSAAESARVASRLAAVESFHGRLTELYADAMEAAVAGRNFLASGDPQDASRWMELVTRLEGSRASLREAPESTAIERQATADFRDALAQLTAISRQALALYGQGVADQARLFLADGADQHAAARMRQALARIEDLAGAEQARQQDVLRQYRQDAASLIMVFLVLAAFMLAAAFTAIQRGMGGRARAERAVRLRSAESLRASRFLQSVVDNIPHIIFIKEAKELRFVRINRAGERVFGHREEEMLGKTDHDFFPSAEAEFFIAKDREVLASGVVLDIPEEEIHTASDGVRLLHTRKLPLVDELGRPTHLLGISEDVTEARHNERQIRELNAQLRARAEEVERINAARSTFLATMSHEIRTPMNGMIGMVELLGLSRLDDRQREMLAVIAESGQSLLRIIDDVLDFSKVEAGKLELREEVASVAAILDDIRNIHSTTASAKGLSIRTQVDEALSPAVWVDPLRLRQVLNNFVSNAVRFTEQGDVEIRVEVLRGDEQRQLLRLSVTDTGVGISPADQEKLFQPFVQVGAGGPGTTGGSGLGLVISRQLAALMGGSVELRSAPGQGTTMSLVVPVRVAPPELLPPPMVQRVAQLREAAGRMRPVPAVADAQREGTLVLVVDDHPVNRMLLQQQLALLGYASEAAPGGAEGLKLWERGRFGLVLTDCQMPGMDGYALARRLRASEAAAHRTRVPVIACTAMVMPGEVGKCHAAGMDDVLFKPVELRALLEKMRRWLPLPGDARGAADRLRPTSAGSADAVVDMQLLRETWGDDQAHVRAVLAAFARSAREDYDALRRASASGDAKAVGHVTHRMLGASRMVGAHGLAESCQLVAAAARDADWPQLGAAMQAVDAEYARLMEGLEMVG